MNQKRMHSVPRKKAKNNNSNSLEMPIRSKFDQHEQKLNLQKECLEWNNTFDRLVNMMSRIVPLPILKLDTPANKRLFLEEMCYDLCEKFKRYQDCPPKKTKTIKKMTNTTSKNSKIQKYEDQIQDLKESIQELENENQDLQERYEKQVQKQEESMKSNFIIESKIDKVHELLEDNLSKLSKDNKPKENRSSPYLNKYSKTPKVDSSDSIYFSLKQDFDPKTTRAISKYRKKVRRAEAMKGKVRNVYPFPETPRSTTPLEPMSQEYIDSTLKTLPHHHNRESSLSRNSEIFSTPKIKRT